jgi:hypothetical protein
MDGLRSLLHGLGTATWVYGLTISLNGLVIVCLEPRPARRLGRRRASGVIACGYAAIARTAARVGVRDA